MRVLLLSNYVADKQFSMLSLADLIENNLSEMGLQTSRCSPPVVFGRFFQTDHGLGKWLGYIDKYILFPIVLKFKSLDFDLVHILDHSNSIYLPYFSKLPTVTHCHDLMAINAATGRYPQVKIRWTGKIQQRWIAKHLKTAASIAVISQATAEDLINILGVNSNRITLVGNPIFEHFSKMPQDETSRKLEVFEDLRPSEFIMHLGAEVWYKNRLGALRIYSELIKLPGREKLKLVMVGTQPSSKVLDFVNEHQLGDNIVFLTNLKKEEIATLYNATACFIFPSFVEGFGLPPVEALSCGALVATSNRRPMTDILGDAVVYFDPELPTEAAQKISEALDNQAFQDELNARGEALIKDFGVVDYHKRILALYEATVENFSSGFSTS